MRSLASDVSIHKQNLISPLLSLLSRRVVHVFPTVTIAVLLSVAPTALLVCTAQSIPPKPGPLTSEYNFNGLSFRYPSNWIVQAHVNSLSVGPSSAFVIKPGGKQFVTHGFFLSVISNASLTLDELTTATLKNLQTNSPRVQTNPAALTHTGNPIYASCGSTLDPSPPYAGTETGLVCTYRVGTLSVAIMTFSPTDQWKVYSSTFADVVSSFSTQAIPNYTPLPPTQSTMQPPRRSTSECSSKHWIESVDGDGKIIKLEDGSIWEVDDVDTVDTSIWLPVSNVVICGTTMINIDDSEKAEVTQILRSGSTSSTARSTKSEYAIQASANDETFVINGDVYKARTYCFNVEKGDKVIFVQGSPSACISAELLNLRTDKVCKVWCP